MSAKKIIAVANDHRGFPIKQQLLPFLKERGYEVIDFGCHSEESADYPDFMVKAAECVSQGRCDLAIGICYTGIGSSIMANKVKGVRASLVHSVEEAKLTRAHNDSNMLILGSGFVAPAIIFSLVETWLDTPFEGGRHEQRVNKIKTYEQRRND